MDPIKDQSSEQTSSGSAAFGFTSASGQAARIVVHSSVSLSGLIISDGVRSCAPRLLHLGLLHHSQETIDKLPCPTCRHIACPDTEDESGDDAQPRGTFFQALQFLQAPLELVGLQATSFVKKCGSAAVTIMACPQYNQSERTRLAHHLRQPVPWAAMIHGQAAHERQRGLSPRALPDVWQVRL